MASHEVNELLIRLGLKPTAVAGLPSGDELYKILSAVIDRIDVLEQGGIHLGD